MSENKDEPAGRSEVANRGGNADSMQTLMLYRISRSAGWVAFFAFVLAAAAGVGGYFFWNQLNILQAQLEELQDLSEKLQKSFDTGVTQSAALEKTLQGLNDQLGRANETRDATDSGPPRALVGSKAGPAVADRPWVGVESMSAGSLQPARRFPITAHVRNAGHTPALNVRAVFRSSVVGAKDIAAPEMEPCTDCAASVLLPNSSASYDAALDGNALTADVVNRIRNGEDTILVAGRLDYTDSAANPHVTNVCMIYLPKLSGFGACAQGNRLD
jgi:hypothetical protein